ncbi:MAG: riboflavin synthase [Chloroflexota bacterium]
MFTGIVEETGTVRALEGHRLVVAARTVREGAGLGDSIAVNGACLTVTALEPEAFTVELSDETLARTNLGALRAGDPVNLERALAANARLGGHIVQGHVDGTGSLVSLEGTTEARVLTVQAPEALARYIVEKGFIAVDGMSLTVVDVRDVPGGGARFTVAVIPYTFDHTVLRSRRAGDALNLEVDILAKYVERLTNRQG